MSDIDERAKLLATYIIETKSTVRQTAKNLILVSQLYIRIFQKD